MNDEDMQTIIDVDKNRENATTDVSSQAGKMLILKSDGRYS